MRLVIFVTLILALLTPALAISAPPPPLIVPALAGDADLVVVGRARLVVSGGKTETLSEQTTYFQVAVVRILKGEVPLNVRQIKITVTPLSVDLASTSHVFSGEFGIYFLRRQQSDEYIPADPYYPVVIASPAPLREQASAPDVLHAIALELTNVLATDPLMLTDRSSGVGAKNGLVAYPPGKPPIRGRAVGAIAYYDDAALALNSMPANIVQAPLEMLTQSKRFSSRLWGILCLMRIGDGDLVSTVVPALQNPTSADIGVVQRIGLALSPSRGLNIPIPILSDLLTSRVAEIRRGAASALREYKSPEIIKPLATVALNDGDAEVRYYAETGLCWATKTRDGPCKLPLGPGSTDSKNESQYRTYWTDWTHANLR